MINVEATFRIRGLFSITNIVKLLPIIPIHIISNVMNAAAYIIFGFSFSHLKIYNNFIHNNESK